MSDIIKGVAIALAKGIMPLVEKGGPALTRDIVSAMVYGSSEEPGLAFSIDVSKIGLESTAVLEQDYKVVSNIGVSLQSLGFVMTILDDIRIGICKP